MSERRRTLAGRDQSVSAFGAVLMRLCDAVGGVAAALVDAEGETVDYAGTIDPFDIKVAAAEMCVLRDVVTRCNVFGWNETQELIVRGGKKTFYAHVLGEHYAVVIQLLPHAFSVSRRGISEAVHELCKEAGLELPAGIAREEDRWWQVEVRCSAFDGRRPDAVWVEGAWCPVEVLGIYSEDLLPREVGYRARLDSGAEITLVRERLGRWYADAPPGR